MNRFEKRHDLVFDKVEALLVSYLDQVEKMIKQVETNIYFLDSVIEEYECLNRTRGTKVSVRQLNEHFDRDEENEKEERVKEMSLFYDKKYGSIPLNKDAIEMRQHMNRFRNYRKKYEFKCNYWPKKAIDNLLNLVHEKVLNVSCEFLISEDCSKEEQEKERTDLEKKTTRELFKYIKQFCEEKDRLEENFEEETCAYTDLTNTLDDINEAPLRIKEEFDYNQETLQSTHTEIRVKREQYSETEEGSLYNHNNSTNVRNILVKLVKTEPTEESSIKETFYSEVGDPSSDTYKDHILEKPKDSMTRFQKFVQMFWNDVAASLNTKHHDASECHKMWLYHDCFCNSGDKWEESEVEKLFEIAEKYEYRNWVNIANELRTSRSPFSCYEKFLQIVKPHKLKEKEEKRNEKMNDRRTYALRIYKKFKSNEHHFSVCHKKDATKENDAISELHDNLIKTENNELDSEGKRFIPLEDIQLQLMVSIIGTNRWNKIKEYFEYLNFYDHQDMDSYVSLKTEHGNKKEKIIHLEYPTSHQEFAFKRRYKRIMKSHNNTILHYSTL